MTSTQYLARKSNRLYFRRRIPRFSTKKSPVFVSLGTKDENLAHIWIKTLTVEFETMLESFTFVIDEIPEDLLRRYMHIRLQQTVTDLQRQSRLHWVTGRSRGAHENRAALQHALDALIDNGPHQPFPASRIDPTWPPEMLADVMALHAAEAKALRSPAMIERLTLEFQNATGADVRSLEHKAQIMRVYLEAKLAAIASDSAERPRATSKFTEFAQELNLPKKACNYSQQPQTKEATEPTPVISTPASQAGKFAADATRVILTPNVEII